MIHVHRGAQGLQALLGEAITGIIISDRWWGYHRLPLEQRQVCWAHLKRDFQKCKERGGEGKIVGELGLLVQEDVFTLWWEFREGLIDRQRLMRQMEPAVEDLRIGLERGSGCADHKVAAFCDNLLALYPRHCGYSQESTGLSPLIITRNGFCGWAYSGGRTLLVATVGQVAASWSES